MKVRVFGDVDIDEWISLFDPVSADRIGEKGCALLAAKILVSVRQDHLAHTNR